MKRRHHRNTCKLVPATAKRFHWLLYPKETAHRHSAKRHHEFGLDQCDLLAQIWQASGHLLNSWWSVAGFAWGHVRPTLKNISNINFCAGKSHGLNNSRQQLSGSSYEWLSSQVFVGARRLSDKHQFGVRIADAKNDLVTERDQMRTFAAEGPFALIDGNAARTIYHLRWDDPNAAYAPESGASGRRTNGTKQANSRQSPAVLRKLCGRFSLFRRWPSSFDAPDVARLVRLPHLVSPRTFLGKEPNNIFQPFDRRIAGSDLYG